MRNFRPVSDTRRKKAGTSSGAKFEKKANMAKHKVITFAPIIPFGNSNSCIICTAFKWDAYDVENIAGNVKPCPSDFRIHLAFRCR